jgi:multiple sugar transport system ATP-binding protein
MTLADRIVVFEAGNIRQVGTPIELYERPANRFVAGFIGTPKMGFFHARLVDREGQRVGIALRDGKGGEATVNFPGHVFRTKEGEVVVGIRPEHCWLDEPEKALVLGEVLEIERLGADTFAFIDVEGADESIAVRVMRTHQNVAPGDRVGINFDPAHAHLFDPAGARV